MDNLQHKFCNIRLAESVSLWCLLILTSHPSYAHTQPLAVLSMVHSGYVVISAPPFPLSLPHLDGTR